MKKLKLFTTSFIAIIAIWMLSQNVIATNGQSFEVKKIEYTEEYQNWLNLPEEERNKTFEPRKYLLETDNVNYLKSINNPLKLYKMQGKSSNARFSLRDIIGDNTKIRDQGNTELCWSFASIGALETNLALQDDKNSNGKRIYDFSEAHMAYATTRNAFLNNQINEKGLNRRVGAPANFYVAQNYLTNGSGAITENEMPFENVGENIDIAKIQNKNITTTLYDTVEFSANSSTEKAQLIENMKSHISEYGGISAAIYGANVFDSEYYNNATGALYVDNESIPMNHAVVIIGWDDAYSRDNFISEHKPQNNGAWIAKNSWGEELTAYLDDVKKINFEANQNEYAQMGIYDYHDLPDDPFIQEFIKNGYTPNENNTVFTYPVGESGYIYISYEDAIVYHSLWGVKKASNEKDYQNIYQNDALGWSQAIQLQSNGEKVYLSNVFKREQTSPEKVNKISLYTIQNWKNCKVYINPNGNDKSKENLQEVKLQNGNVATNTIDIDVGYHTIELAEAITVNSDYFAVVLQLENDSNAIVPVEAKMSNGWENAIVNPNESFFTSEEGFNKNIWQDFALLENEQLRGNVILKALTEKEATNYSNLASISITKQPNKTDYKAGENFNTDGMEVMATYEDGEKRIVSNYQIEDGTNLQEGKNAVTVSYTENNITKRTTQPITVSANTSSPMPKSPKASDFSEASAFITDINISSSTEGSIADMTIHVSNIKIGDQENQYTYYYCISKTSDSTQVKDNNWVEIPANCIQKETNGIFGITLKVDLNKSPNFSEWSNSEKIYLHLKEKAEMNQQQIETINVLDIRYNIGDSNIGQAANQNDNTIANKILPKTGKINVIIATLAILGIGVFCYIRYKNIDR